MTNDHGGTMRWSMTRHRLSEDGFTAIAVIDPDALPATLREAAEVAEEDRLVALAASGTELWEQMTQSEFSTHADPIDAYSAACLGAALDECDAVVRWRIRYPGDGNAPLMALAEWLGWTTPSPLGIGIHQKHGLWFAWRALAVVTPVSAHAIPTTEPTQTASPCISCSDSPCVTSCPANAVSRTADFDLKRCLDFRLMDNSPCASSCLARLACPVGGASRYPAEQFAYHQTRALHGMQRWLKNQ